MKSLYLLVLVIAISVTSCRTKEGEPGPAGESNLIKQGTMSGTITYMDEDGNEATVPFDYQYYESLDDNKFYYEEETPDLNYQLAFGRREIKDYSNYFYVQAYGNGTNGVEATPSYMSLNISLLKVVNNYLYEFECNVSSAEITNLSLDPSTGRLIFDFTSDQVYYNGPEYGTITGRVDVILNRSSNGVIDL